MPESVGAGGGRGGAVLSGVFQDFQVAQGVTMSALHQLPRPCGVGRGCMPGPSGLRKASAPSPMVPLNQGKWLDFRQASHPLDPALLLRLLGL